MVRPGIVSLYRESVKPHILRQSIHHMRIKHVVMKKNLLLVYFILSALSLPAQHILVGDVLDSIDSLPVPCAGIIIYPQDTTIVADTMGHLCTTVCESDAVLVFKCVGYYDKKSAFYAERNNGYCHSRGGRVPRGRSKKSIPATTAQKWGIFASCLPASRRVGRVLASLSGLATGLHSEVGKKLTNKLLTAVLDHIPPQTPTYPSAGYSLSMVTCNSW